MVAGRDDHGRFIKGNTGGGGRPRGLAEQARAVTKDGKVIIDFMLSVLSDSSQSTKDRHAAAEYLSDRGWGRAVQQSDINLTGGVMFTAEDLRQARSLLEQS